LPPLSGSTWIVRLPIELCKRFENFLLADGSKWGYGEWSFSLFPIVKRRIPFLHDVARAFHLFGHQQGCGLTRMPESPGATIEAIVRSGVGSKRSRLFQAAPLPNRTGGTVARRRHLGTPLLLTSTLLVGARISAGKILGNISACLEHRARSVFSLLRTRFTWGGTQKVAIPNLWERGSVVWRVPRLVLRRSVVLGSEGGSRLG
jgi:hypothetical protein